MHFYVFFLLLVSKEYISCIKKHFICVCSRPLISLPHRRVIKHNIICIISHHKNGITASCHCKYRVSVAHIVQDLIYRTAASFKVFRRICFGVSPWEIRALTLMLIPSFSRIAFTHWAMLPAPLSSSPTTISLKAA